MVETDRFPVKSLSRDSTKSYHYISSSCARTQCDASSGAFFHQLRPESQNEPTDIEPPAHKCARSLNRYCHFPIQPARLPRHRSPPDRGGRQGREEDSLCPLPVQGRPDPGGPL